MKMKNGFSKFVSAFSVVALLLFLIGPQLATAATSLTAASDTMSREETSTASLHAIKFTSTSGIVAGNTITIVFPSGFTTTGLATTDLQICHGAFGTATVTGGTACSSSTESISSSASGGLQWGATITISGTTTIVLTAPPSMTYTIPSAQAVTITIAAVHMINPSAASTPNITIATTLDTLGDSVTVPIIANDQIGVTATVNQSVTFTVGVGTTNSTTGTSVPLNTLSTAGATYSNGSGVNSIWLDIGTNTSGGAVVTVQSANAALKSTSVGTDTIPSTTGVMAPATPNYGLCVKSVAQTSGTLAKVAPFASTCGYSSTNSIGGVTTSAQPIINTSNIPISGGIAEVVVNAENSAITPAHTDYGDTLTFIATGTF